MICYLKTNNTFLPLISEIFCLEILGIVYFSNAGVLTITTMIDKFTVIIVMVLCSVWHQYEIVTDAVHSLCEPLSSVHSNKDKINLI